MAVGRPSSVRCSASTAPPGWRTPKERWILGRIGQHLADGRNVILFLRHTGKGGLPKRYQQLLRLHLGAAAVILDAARIRPAEREAWLNEHVIRPGCRILITNPRAVQTGLNNLVHFSAAVWAEGVDFDARVVRQANGRIHRVGQTRDVVIEVPYYKATAQATALDLVARKVSASLQVDGLSLEGALRRAIARAVVAYCDGMQVKTFVGERTGTISDRPRGARKFYWDRVFIPEDASGRAGDWTYAEIVEHASLGLAYKIRELSQSSAALKKFLEYRLSSGEPELWR